MDSFTFKHPFTAIVAGPTKAGKTTFVVNLIKNKEKLIGPTPRIIWWCYMENQPSYKQLEHVNFIKGLPDVALLRQHEPEPQLLILDDMMQEMATGRLAELFTRGCHHWGITVLHIVQNLFFHTLRTARINTDYVILMKSPNDKLQAHTLARQLFPEKQKYFLESYADATSVPYGYLMLDLTQETPDHLRILTDIFSKHPTYYVEKL